MSSNQSLEIITWLLNRFGCGQNAESALGDLVEHCHSGKSRRWYWKQITIVLILGFRGVLLGLTAGGVVGIFSIAQNIRRNDPHGISFFPDAISPAILVVIVYFTIRYWWRSGLTEVLIRRGLRQFALGAAVVMAFSHAVFGQWWFGRSVSFYFHPSSLIAGIGFVLVVLLVMLSGRLAVRFARPPGKSLD
jgi:hypothetical protein